MTDAGVCDDFGGTHKYCWFKFVSKKIDVDCPNIVEHASNNRDFEESAAALFKYACEEIHEKRDGYIPFIYHDEEADSRSVLLVIMDRHCALNNIHVKHRDEHVKASSFITCHDYIPCVVHIFHASGEDSFHYAKIKNSS